MRRRGSRFWRAVMWSGTGACALAAVAWLLSLWFRYSWASTDQRTFLSFALGQMSVLRLDRRPDVPLQIENGFTFSGWFPQLTREHLGLVLPSAGPTFGPVSGFWCVPVWVVLLALLVPTGIGWIRSRRHPPGRCQGCGYNLTGNESGTCPECGAVVDATATDVRNQD